MLENWKGKVNINGVEYNTMREATDALDTPLNGNIHIVLKPNVVKAENKAENVAENVADAPKEYRITVKQYMTKEATPEFDFMAKWNNNKPMPLRVMTGHVLQETRGMVKMRLHGDIWAEKICTCMCCGRKLTNPVSQYFGIGPECGGHNYVNPFEDDSQLKEAVAEYKKQLQATVWEGWVIKSSLLKFEEIT